MYCTLLLYLHSGVVRLALCVRVYLFRAFASMRVFESDCNDGRGNAVACHQVGEFLSVVKSDFRKAGKLFEMNCETRKHAPSCFNLGRFLREHRPSLCVCVYMPSSSFCLLCMLVIVVRFALLAVDLQYTSLISLCLTVCYYVVLVGGNKTVKPPLYIPSFWIILDFVA